MKLIKFERVVLIGMISIITLVSHAQEIELKSLAFNDQEKITYGIYYNWKFVWIPAGEVSFVVKDKEDHFEFEVTGKSYSSYDSFFKVRDNYVSRVNKNTLAPINFRRDILEGNYCIYDSISFEQDGVVEEFFGKSKAKAKRHKFEIECKLLDMVSCIYYLRSLSLNEMKRDTKIPFKIFFDKELFELDVIFRGEEKVKIKNIGRVDTWHIQPELIDGYVFKKGDVMNIWTSKDQNKIPLLIESPISYGSIKAVLKSAKGLAFPFDYKLD